MTTIPFAKDTPEIERAILSILCPLTGDPGRGLVMVSSSTGGAVTLPPRAHGYAILAPVGNAANVTLPNGGSIPAAGVLGTSPPAMASHMLVVLDDGEALPGGAAIGAKTVSGGLRANLVPGTRIFFDPPIPGVEAEAVVGPAGFSGATAPPAYAGVRTVATYEAVDAREVADDLFRAGINEFPAIALVYVGRGDKRPAGVRRWITEERWSLVVVTSRNDGDPLRRNECVRILDAAEGLLDGRSSVELRMLFSAPAPLRTRARNRVSFGPTAYVWALAMTTERGIAGASPHGSAEGYPVPRPWTQTKTTATTGEPPIAIVSGAIDPMG